MRTFVPLAALLSLFVSCECSEEFEHLTLGISATPDQSVTAGITTPRWGGTWEQPASMYLVAIATVGPADPLPPDDAFELYDVTDAEPLQLAYVPRPCAEVDEEPIGSCANTGGDGCNSMGLDWLQDELFTVGREYLLVHRRANGTGKPLNFEGEGPAVEFDGEPALTMRIDVVAD